LHEIPIIINYIFFLGSIGFLSKLSSNYFAISPTLHRKDVRLFEYKVEFNPVEDTLDDQLKRLNIHKEFLGPIIFNGTSMYSYKKYSPKVSFSKRFVLFLL